MASQKPHIVCIPVPLQGHLNAIIKLANILHSRDFYITLVLTESNFTTLASSLGSEFLSLRNLHDFRVETIPDGLPLESKRGIFDLQKLVLSFLEDETKKPIRGLLKRLLSSNDIPQISFIISDIFMFVAHEFGEELGIPVLSFATIDACVLLGLMPYDDELVKRGYISFKDGECYLTDENLDKPINWVPGLSKWAKLKHILAFMRNPSTITYNYIAATIRHLLHSNAVICNTFDDLEGQVVLKAIKAKLPNFYNVGPLTLLCQELNGQERLPLTLSLWKEDDDCLKWLNNRSSKSVIYVNYGSLAILTLDQLEEFAWGLANSNHAFLWVIRSDLVDGVSSIVTNEYMKDIEGRGLISSWCPQDKVLQHPSIAVFFSHCGWNSMLESIGEGVPMICWPRFGDQIMNCLYACQEWRIAVEMEEGDVRRDKVEELVKEMIDGEKGKELQRNAFELKKKAKEATRYGGSSYDNFDKLVNYLKKREISS